jgi:predicted protein tyrosine phosphatase
VEYFTESLAFIQQARASNTACLVHCHAGMSRSASVVLAYIVDRCRARRQRTRTRSPAPTPSPSRRQTGAPSATHSFAAHANSPCWLRCCSEGLSLLDALAMVRGLRPMASPNPSFMAQVRALPLLHGRADLLGQG